jgi:hypothetical protein
MLEYSKQILQKVSFDSYLFERELLKAIINVLDEKLIELKVWCFNNFYSLFPEILERCFSEI